MTLIHSFIAFISTAQVIFDKQMMPHKHHVSLWLLTVTQFFVKQTGSPAATQSSLTGSLSGEYFDYDPATKFTKTTPEPTNQCNPIKKEIIIKHCKNISPLPLTICPMSSSTDSFYDLEIAQDLTSS